MVRLLFGRPIRVGKQLRLFHEFMKHLPKRDNMSQRMSEFSSKYLSTTTTADEKQVRKDHHIKAFKNPSEMVVALTLAATKKATIAWHRLVVLGMLSGCKYKGHENTDVSVHNHWRNCGSHRWWRNTTYSHGYDTKWNCCFRNSNCSPCFGSFDGWDLFPRKWLPVPPLMLQVALMLIVFLGGELFTGNTMIMTLGLLAKKITWVDLLKSCSIALISNWAGSLELTPTI
jgi:hypothetical protein